MAVYDGSMDPATLLLTVFLSSVASLACLVIVVILCSCCYRPKDDDYAFKEYEPISTNTPETKRKSILQQMPLLFGSKPSIRVDDLQKPGTMSVQNVQPDPTSQSSINTSLGIGHTGGSTLSKQDSIGKLPPIQGKLTMDRRASAVPNYTIIPNREEDYPDHQLGKLQFTIEYDFTSTTLMVKIHRAIGLIAKDFSGTSDPYVKVIILPDKQHKLETKVRKRCLNPVWNEIFCFEGFPYNKLESKTLLLQVMDYDRFSRDDVIGEVTMPLNSVDVIAAATLWRYVQPSSKTRGKLGELLLSLCYQPTSSLLTVVILKARDLKAKDIIGSSAVFHGAPLYSSSDPYVKLWLMYKDKRLEKKKTLVEKNNLAPVFNESFQFDIPFERIRETSLIVSVMDYDKMGRNELIGKFVLGHHSGPLEKKHWTEMLHKSRTTITQWHILKD